MEKAFPIVISPRSTKVLSEHPVLRWTEVKDASTYHLMVRGPELLWTTVIESKTELTYPPTAPKLEAGQQYKFIVAVDNEHYSEVEEVNGLGFSLLSSKERKTVLNQQKRLEQLSLEQGPTQYLVARLYGSTGLNAEAIQELEDAAKVFKSPATERLLGELYLKVQLARQAETHYSRALELSKKEKDDEGEMQCNLALATIYSRAFGNARTARRHFEAAIAIADRVGDNVTANLARKQLSE